MRNLFLLVVIAAAAFAAGWFTICRDDEHTTIRFNRDEIRNDARLAIDRGREILNRQDQGQAMQDPAHSHPENRTAAHSPTDWSQPPSPYPMNQPSQFQPAPWQPPVEWQQPPYSAPYPQQGYPAPRQY